jgi:hypothetical protein
MFITSFKAHEPVLNPFVGTQEHSTGSCNFTGAFHGQLQFHAQLVDVIGK